MSLYSWFTSSGWHDTSSRSCFKKPEDDAISELEADDLSAIDVDDLSKIDADDPSEFDATA